MKAGEGSVGGCRCGTREVGVNTTCRGILKLRSKTGQRDEPQVREDSKGS